GGQVVHARLILLPEAQRQEVTRQLRGQVPCSVAEEALEDDNLARLRAGKRCRLHDTALPRLPPQDTTPGTREKGITPPPRRPLVPRSPPYRRSAPGRAACSAAWPGSARAARWPAPGGRACAAAPAPAAPALPAALPWRAGPSRPAAARSRSAPVAPPAPARP